MTCAFCSFVFDENGSRHQCQGCLMAGGCRSVRCPRCAYEMPEELGLVKWLRAWMDKLQTRRSASAKSASRAHLAVVGSAARLAAIPLAELRPGESGVVVELRPGKNGQVQKCLALGILPGASITLRKRSPSFIFELGFSQFAVDEGMAGAVLVQPSRARS